MIFTPLLFYGGQVQELNTTPHLFPFYPKHIPVFAHGVMLRLCPHCCPTFIETTFVVACPLFRYLVYINATPLF